LVAGFALAACNRGLSTAPTVFVDDGFTPAQTAAAEAGMALWEPALRFRHETMAHDLIVAHAEEIDGDDVVYLVRSRTADCPGTNHTPGLSGITHRAKVNAAAVSCIDTGNTRDVAAVVAHELGHAMGLEHEATPVALMNPRVTAPAPVCEDWRQLAGVMGTTVPATCAGSNQRSR
jgi:predicted Zn-dependent protease